MTIQKSGVPHCVLITGATGGIGSALAHEYARAGSAVLILHGRNKALLQELGDACRALGARVVTAAFDIRDHEAVRGWIKDISATEAPDLIIANAGVNINTGTAHEGEEWSEIHRLLEVNVKAALATVHAALPAMRARRGGQVALISSLAAWRGLPETPSYSASKAAVKAYGEAMRDALAGEGVRVNVIMPGYVESQMCLDMPGPKPFLWKAPKAARVIRLGLRANRARISFPFPLNLGCFLLAGLHPAVAGWFLRRLGYE
ncbi:SDR family NAD(P)-dependent oxidoreductase [Caballeronia hypogeia]|nr:SDR family NAD(P)-dependent oxidoreductase [Caballeronia hypogeia]